MHTTPRRLVGVLAAGACALAPLALLAGTSPADAANRHRPHHPRPHHHSALMPIQLLSFNDFHGNLEPPAGSSGRNVVDHKIDPATGKPVDVTADAGGAAYLATHLAQARKGHPNSLTVAAGDIIGASPLLSAAFHDEPTIESMNRLGLDVTAVGNHEFDEGYKELQRMAHGGCIADGPNGANNQNSCADHTFKGAKFDYLAANVKYAGTNQTILPSYSIKNVHGAKIGFIGMTLKDTPSIVTASGVAGLEFSDEVQTANKLVPVLKRKGVNAIVVLIHQGGLPDKQKWTDPATGTTYDVNPNYDYTCGKGGTLAASSPILPIAANLDPAIDMVISGHTHQPYVCSRQGPDGPSAAAHLGLVVRPAVHRDRPALQPPHQRHRPRLGEGLQPPGQPRRDARPRADLADRPLQEPGHADREQGDRAHQRPTSPPPRTPRGRAPSVT